MAYLIQTPTGEQMTVESLDGHEDCTVLDATAPAVTLADAKEMKRGEVDIFLFMQFQAGFTPATGPIAGKTLQARDDTDRTNWLTAKDIYRDGIAAGNGDTPGLATFRCADNSSVNCTYNEGYAALQGMADWGDGLMKKSWAVKDQIDALTDAAAVEAFDVAAQWALL